MLGMLMKYEWKYIWKKFLLFAGLMIVATAIGCLSCSLFSGLDVNDPDGFATIGFGMLGYMIYYTILMGSIIGFTLIVAIRFYRSVFGGMGYITHTLPVSTRQVYGSHLLLYGICMLVITVLTQFSVTTVSDMLFTGVFGSLEDAQAPMPFQGGMMSWMLGEGGFGRILLMIVYLTISALSSLIVIYASIVLGQYWKKHKVWGAVVSYLIITTIMTVIVCFTIIPYMLTMLFNGETMEVSDFIMGSGFWWINLAYTSVFGLASLWIVDHGMTKRLNLE